MSNLSEFDDSASTTSTTHSDFGGADGFGGICDLLRRCLLSALLRAMPLARRPRGLQPRLAERVVRVRPLTPLHALAAQCNRKPAEAEAGMRMAGHVMQHRR
jgi:hypothetical protein